MGDRILRFMSLPEMIFVIYGVSLLLLFGYCAEAAESTLRATPAFVDVDHYVDLHSQTNQRLSRRDEFNCGPGKPCRNGACCGASGYCGYGPDYCGDGCQSNCDAVAECGKFAQPVGKKCPLNTCCSQWGFCGTTEEFCNSKCQSNCVLHPKPSGSRGSPLQKVIGYYESWSNNLLCHKMSPQDLPLEALTHLNYAFASINPSTFELVTMDDATPESLFQEVVDLKKYKSDLEVWLSVGGWTFSDNGTATQPVFGNIARSEANRRKFASNAVKFLNHYGFDGLDVDWEYPGAPDRGGKVEDIKNFVLLMKTLRATFDASPRRLGLTFTAPSSFWYLRWFDLPGLLRYSDWVNVMSYDLHGVWDRDNPIGNIIQGHTNLTEIKLAFELFWRVNVPPSKVNMGFGFYGRSFELADKSCTTPGCPFSGGAAPGTCSQTSGVLLYYEIKALLDQHTEQGKKATRDTQLKPIHDKDAAVKYLVFNDNQWVSYDDHDTYKQKIDWARDIGIGGSLIWATDTDDDKYSSHSALLGKSIKHADLEQIPFEPSDPGSISENLLGQNGQDCFIKDDCTDQDNPMASSCGSAVHVGWERSNCGSKYAKSICCPAATAPKKCIWRGSGGDCNGQCHVGESTLFRSSWGGFPTESNQRRCSRGAKVFCCDAGDWDVATSGCTWVTGSTCKDGYDSVARKWYNGTYCCPRPNILHDCHWVGTAPDCPDAKCPRGEVTLFLDEYSEGGQNPCNWNRKKTLCCKVTKPPPKELKCEKSICDYDSTICDNSDTAGAEINDIVPVVPSELVVRGTHQLARRGAKRAYSVILDGVTYIINSRPYPSRGDLFRVMSRPVLERFFRQIQGSCNDPTVISELLKDPKNPKNLPATGETEHTLPPSWNKHFLTALNTGMVGKHNLETPRYSGKFLKSIYLDSVLSESVPPVVPGARAYRSVSERVFEAMGSNTNRANFVLASRQINAMKNRLFESNNPLGHPEWTIRRRGAVRGNRADMEFLLEIFRTVLSVFRYHQLPEIQERYNNTVASVRAQLNIGAENIPAAMLLPKVWDEYIRVEQQMIIDNARTWAQTHIDILINDIMEKPKKSDTDDDDLKALRDLRDKTDDIKFP